jgi:hypothetical protein
MAGVPTIECSPAMWRFVRAWRSACGPQVVETRTALGPWTATVIKSRGAELILAVEGRTYLALLFKLEAEATFAPSWKNALSRSLDDLGVSPARIAQETRAASFRLQPLVDDASMSMLSAVEFVCSTELHYQPDLAVVQRRLNEFPHDHPPDYSPVAAIHRLFGTRR